MSSNAQGIAGTIRVNPAGNGDAIARETPAQAREVERRLHEHAMSEARQGRILDRTAVAVGRALLIAVALMFWGYASGTWLDAQSISDPMSVLHALTELVSSGRLWPQLWQTVKEVFVGYFAGALAGAVLAFGFALMPSAERVFRPFLLALYSIPKIALAPLIVMWFGLGIAPKIVLAGMFVFFIVFMNAVTGIQSVNSHHVNIMRVMGATRFAMIRKIVLPTMVPFLLLGLRISIPEAMTGAVIGEFIAASRGLGYLVYSASNEMNMAVSLAALVVLVGVVAVADFGLGLVEHALPWQPASSRTIRSGMRPR
jgi:NitT/TauT family transport system permease protein